MVSLLQKSIKSHNRQPGLVATLSDGVVYFMITEHLWNTVLPLIRGSVFPGLSNSARKERKGKVEQAEKMRGTGKKTEGRKGKDRQCPNALC